MTAGRDGGKSIGQDAFSREAHLPLGWRRGSLRFITRAVAERLGLPEKLEVADAKSQG